MPSLKPIEYPAFVRYWPRGDMSREHWAGIVTYVDRQGRCEVTCLTQRGGVRQASGARHFSDTYLADHPQEAVECGVWDYVESDPRAMHKPKRPEQKRKPTQAPQTAGGA